MIQINFLKRESPLAALSGAVAPKSGVALVALLVGLTALLYGNLLFIRRQIAAIEMNQATLQEALDVERRERRVAAAETSLQNQLRRRWAPLLQGMKGLAQPGVQWLRANGQGQELAFTAKVDQLGRVGSILADAAHLPGAEKADLIRAQQDLGGPVAAGAAGVERPITVELKVRLTAKEEGAR